jgi:glycosidase
MKYIILTFVISLSLLLFGCGPDGEEKKNQEQMQQKKAVVYQVFTRLWGNTNTTNKPWGTIEENGVGKFADFTQEGLREIASLGATHIWYTGVPHHAVIRDYTEFGISQDDPDVVKGRAGSPYAVKDYYSVDPDLAISPALRMQEFESLVVRSHRANLKVIIDIVPNHVARTYESLGKPDSVEDFGASDDPSQAYRRDNDFYYIPGEDFQVPESKGGYQPMGGDPHPLSDGQFEESPAKWTGNGSRKAQPDFNDWYETVKINYGIRPDGSKDFPELPEGYAQQDYQAHHSFWQGKEVPSSWKKFRDIAFFWMDKGVDGFRYDMAEMVPVEFWSYMNSAIKMKNPEAFLLAEIYNPARYRDYLHLGKMDYLYDKVEMYDTLRNIIEGRGSTDHIAPIQEGLADIEHHMLHFLENHDEQRIASPAFAGDPEKAKPAMVVSAAIGTSPTMIYFGQEVGEPGAEDPGFGDPTRTSIFDYVGVPHHQRWLNNKRCDGGQLKAEEEALRDFYQRLLTFTRESSALMGGYRELHTHNRSAAKNYNDKLFSFARWSDEEKLFIITNFDAEEGYSFELEIPEEVIEAMGIKNGEHMLEEKLYGTQRVQLRVMEGKGNLFMKIGPLESLILGR